MKFQVTELPGVFIIDHHVHKDTRGALVKTFHKEEFSKMGLECDFKESYYTRSKEDVIRGMHFQISPHDHAKLVTIIHGTVVDVILDLRLSSPTCGRHFAIELSRENRKSIYIPRGCAHGFLVLGESAIVYYMATAEYSPSHDKGIRFDSFGYDWKTVLPVVSSRDMKFPTLDDFDEFFQ